MEESVKDIITQVSEVVWEVPASFKRGMNVPARIYGTKNIVNNMDKGVFDQVTNVASLPGIQKYAYCMPDGHWGYGFPIGGVAAFDPEDGGVISPGGIGFDINCGMRLLTANLTFREVKPKLRSLIDTLFRMVPAGVGSSGFLKVNRSQFEDIMVDGSRWCIDNGYGWGSDLDRTEENGCIKNADPSKISDRAYRRGLKQLGTLGSGNHYLEVQVSHAEEIFDEKTAKRFGIHTPDQIVIMFHCGSRGFGHQVGTDYLKLFNDTMPKYGIDVLDKELACAPFNSDEGQDYYSAMACAANMAFVNRQIILNQIRKGFSEIFGRSSEELEMNMIYDVAHNIAKMEKHTVGGKVKRLVVHRKGATRCFGPGEEEVPDIYKDAGQPVIVGGSMETGSYLLAGTNKAREETFGSTCHGSGRTMSRKKAKQLVRGEDLQKEMAKRGIYVHAVSYSGLAEEAGIAYKDISEVVESMEIAGVSRKVAALRPIGNVKG